MEPCMCNLHAVYKMYKSCGIRISMTTSLMSQYNKSHENLYLVLKIMHTISECAMRFVYDKVLTYHSKSLGTSLDSTEFYNKAMYMYMVLT